MRNIANALIFILLLAACAKQEGEGGRSTISGKVYAIDYPNDWDSKLDTFPAADEDVFIVYGDEERVSDDLKTFYDGSFSFEYLTKGDYKIYVYSNDFNDGEIQEAIIRDVEISSNSDDVTVEDIYIYKSDEGTCSVKGKVFVNDYNSEMLPKVPAENYYGPDEDVYIRIAGADTYIDKTSTNENGEYRFSRLPAGEYEIYAFSENPVRDALGRLSNKLIVKMVKISIKETFTDAEAEEIVIVK